ncbi:MAG: hypothetical protein J6Y47_02640 [Bacteroidales bacterium]|nr:hypothetical protein [Bacteroidales bacterium]
MKKYAFILAAIATVVMFASCDPNNNNNKPDPDDPDKPSEIDEQGGTMTYDGTTYELTTACQYNHGKTYQGSDIPRNYITLSLYKEVIIEHDGSKYYDTLHYINIGAFCNDDALSEGTYTFETTAGHQTWLNSHALVWYEFNNVGEVFQKSSVFSGNVTIKKSGNNYTIDVDWVDDANKTLKAHYVGAVPSGEFKFLER